MKIIQVVVESGAIPVFVELINSNDIEVKSQTIWALGNIAGDNAATRDFVLSYGALPPLCKVAKYSQTISKLFTSNLKEIKKK